MIFNFGYFEINSDGKKVYKFLKYSTGITINPDHWQIKKQRIKSTIDEPNWSEYNTTLDKLEYLVKKVYGDFINEGINPNIDQIKDKLVKLDPKRKNTDDNTPKNLFNFLSWYVKKDNITYMPNGGNPVIINDRTLQKYKSTVTLLEDYANDKRRGKLNFEDLNEKFYIDFVEYCRKTKNHKENTIGKHVQTLKTLLKAATKEGVNNNSDYKDFKVSDEAVEKIYLTETDLLKIYRKDLTGHPGLDKVRDLFLIGCYTALRFSDYSNIKKENLYTTDKGEFLKIKTQKTGETVVIPIHSIVRAICEKYEWDLPKAISNQKTNDYIKDIGEKANIKEIISITSVKGGVKITKNFFKYELISSHTARRSAATNMYKAGIPTISIKKITGHKSEASFLRYINITGEENAEILMNSDFFKGKLAIL